MYKIKWEEGERDINGIFCDTNSYSNFIEKESLTKPIFVRSLTQGEILQRNFANGHASKEIFYDAYNPSMDTSNYYEPYIIQCNIPILHGTTIEFPKDNPFNLSELWISSGKEFIEVKNSKRFVDQGSMANFQLSDIQNNHVKFNVLNLEKSNIYLEHFIRHLKDNRDNYNLSKSIGAVARTKNNNFWICYRQATQRIADLDNWLHSLSFNYYLITLDEDLSESTSHSGGITGKDLPEFIN